MFEKFKKAVAAVPEVADYRITEVNKKSSELFYVLDKLETTRGTETTSYYATIYINRDDKRGSADFNLYSYMSVEEIAEKIKENVFAASFALDPYYEIPKKEEATIPESMSNLKEGKLKDHLPKIVNAVFKADTYEKGYLAATEFFLYETNVRIVNSNGVDLRRTGYSGNIELIPSWDTDKDEVEIYHMMDIETVDEEEITKQVDELLLLAKARAEAVKLKLDKPIKVILQDDEVAQTFTFYTSNLNYFKVYSKSNRFEVGKSVQGDNITGDKLTLSLVPYYKGAMNSRAFDGDGVVLKEVKLIEDGIAKSFHGEYRFGYYLGEKQPTGEIPVRVVKPGKTSFSEMANEPYVRCVRFSGMQMDTVSGYIGGEVRLGFYFDGEKEIPVTGFSVAGNMNELKGSIVYSSEEQTTKNFHGPKYLAFTGMNVL